MSENNGIVEFSIIIVNHNTSDEVQNCINSILSKIDKMDFKLLIVDNNSESEEICSLKNGVLRNEIIYLKENIGFGSAINFAVKEYYSKYLAFINPDIIFLEDSVTPIFNFINSRNDIGACGPMLLYENQRIQNSSGPKMNFFYEIAEAFGFIGLVRYFQNIKYLNSKITEPIQVSWVSGAFMMISREAFDQVDGFDENFFLNYEDIDLCRRLEEKGYKNYYFPQTKSIHLDHKSFGKNYELLVYTRYQSKLIYLNKHYNKIGGLLLRVVYIVGLFLKIFLSSFFMFKYGYYSRLKGYTKSLILYLKIF